MDVLCRLTWTLLATAAEALFHTEGEKDPKNSKRYAGSTQQFVARMLGVTQYIEGLKFLESDLQTYQELEREAVVYVKRGQGTFVAPMTKKNSRERQNLARAVAKRTLIEARRSGLDVHELIATLKEVAAEEKE